MYQAQKVSMKPIHEKKKTRPWRSMGFNTGMLRAFLLIGLSSGLRQRSASRTPMAEDGFI